MGDGNADVGDGQVWLRCEGMGGSGVMSSAGNVLEMSLVRGEKGVGGVCKMCVCLARGGVKCVVV